MRCVDTAIAFRNLGQFVRQLGEHRYRLLGGAQQIAQLVRGFIAPPFRVQFQVLDARGRGMYGDQIVGEGYRLLASRFIFFVRGVLFELFDAGRYGMDRDEVVADGDRLFASTDRLVHVQAVQLLAE